VPVVLFEVVDSSSLISPSEPAASRSTPATKLVLSASDWVAQLSVVSAVAPEVTTPPRETVEPNATPS